MQLIKQKREKFHLGLRTNINYTQELLVVDIEIEKVVHLNYQNGIKDRDIK